MSFKIASQKFMEVQHAILSRRLIRADLFDTWFVKCATTLVYVSYILTSFCEYGFKGVKDCL